MVLAAASCSPHLASAQGFPSAGVGSRVRLTFASPRTPQAIGRIVDLRTDSLTLERRDAFDRIVLPVSAVQKVEVSMGRKSRVGQGIGVGALIGTLAAAVTIYLGSSMATACDESGGGAGWCSEVTTGNALQLLGIGAATGGLIGYLKTREPGDIWAATRWKEHPKRNLGLSFGINRGGPQPARRSPRRRARGGGPIALRRGLVQAGPPESSR